MSEKHSKPGPAPGTRLRHFLLWVIFVEVMVLLTGMAWLIFVAREEPEDSLLEQDITIAYEELTEPDLDLCVPKPEIDKQLLPVNAYSRPGDKIDGVEYLVIHYLANPGTTAQQNHDYFANLKDLKDTYMSANYIVGMDGEIIQCVPDDEIAYASNDENHESISIENCHPDSTGKFTKETYASLVHLTAYLSERYGLGRDQIIRHYDVTRKLCPKYYVLHEDKWEQFRDDVMALREQYRAEAESRIEVDPISSELDVLIAETDITGEE